MPALVRVRNLDDLRQAVDAAGTQTDVASAAHMVVQRLNQLMVGSHTVLGIRKAMRLEQEAVGMPLGSLFVAVDGALLLPYIPGLGRCTCGGDQDATATAA